MNTNVARPQLTAPYTTQTPGRTPNPEFTFAGFDLMHVPTIAAYSSKPGRNIQAAGYTKVTFYARGSLSTYTVVKIDVSEPA